MFDLEQKKMFHSFTTIVLSFGYTLIHFFFFVFFFFLFFFFFFFIVFFSISRIQKFKKDHFSGNHF